MKVIVAGHEGRGIQPHGTWTLAVAVLALYLLGLGAQSGGGTGGSPVASLSSSSQPSRPPTLAEARPGPADGSASPWSLASHAATPGSGESAGAVPPGFDPSGVWFINPDEGWVIGEAPCGDAKCTVVARTRDGGRRWETTGAPATAGASQQARSTDYVRAIRFADEHHGWAFYPELWATHDGGASWRQVRLGNPILSLETTAGRVYAVVGSCPGSMGECTGPVRLYEAEVGSDDWRSVLEVELKPGHSSNWVHHNGGLEVNDEAVYLMVEPNASGPEDGEPPLLFTRSPAGRWERRQNAPCDWGGGLTARGPRNLVFLCQTGEGAFNQAVYELYESSDGARSWTLEWRSRGRVPHMAIVADTTEARYVAWFTGELDVERRDGRRHTVWFNASGQTEIFPSVRFVDPQHGTALTSLVYITHDSDLTWEPIRFQP